MPQFMVIERFKAGHSAAVYERYEARGRMLPPGLRYLDSWLSAEDDVCYQLMETDSPECFDNWTARWDDLVEFELVELMQKPTGRVK